MAIASAIVLPGLPLVAFTATATPFLSGLFDPVNDAALLLVTPLALFNAWTTVIVGALILTYGGIRVDLPTLPVRFFPVRPWVWAASSLLAVPVVWRTVSYTHSASGHSRLVMLGYAGLGTIAAIALLFAALWINGLLDDTTSALRRKVRLTMIERAYARLLVALSRWPAVSSGFLVEGDGGTPELAPGHGLALGLASSSVLLYVTTGFLTRNVERPVLASALAYVLLLLLVLTWLVGVATFLVDRSRVPLVVVAVVWALVVNTALDRFFPTDHVYRRSRSRHRRVTSFPRI